VEREDLRRERARQVLDRYGVVFRELLAREAPALRWGELVRTLQILELGGECVGGWFLRGPTGLQFASPEALETLQAGMDEDRVFWVNAADPVSPCGLGLEGLELPRRLRSTHLVYAGRELVLVSERNGARLDIRVPPHHPRLVACMGVLEVLLTRDFQPFGHLTVETINGAGALGSPYRRVLEGRFEVSPGPSTLRVSPRLS
jgi:ATP-dependent Lhr-like helicase